MNDSTITLAQRVRQHRKQAGLSQKTLAKLVGVSQQAIVALEKGDIADPKRIVEIAEALGVSARYLKGLTDDPTPIITREQVRAQIDDNLSPEALAQIWALIRRHKPA